MIKPQRSIIVKPSEVQTCAPLAWHAPGLQEAVLGEWSGASWRVERADWIPRSLRLSSKHFYPRYRPASRDLERSPRLGSTSTLRTLWFDSKVQPASEAVLGMLVNTSGRSS